MEDVASELVNGLMTLMASFVMVFVIFLPFLAIPYVFIKMGGIVSGFAKMASAPFRAGKFAAKRVGKKVTDAGLDRAGLYGRRKLGDFSSSDPALTRKGKPRRLGKRTFKYANKAAGWMVDGDKESASRKAILEREEKKRHLDALIGDKATAERSAGTKDPAAVERVQTVARSQREQLRAEDIKIEKERIIQEGIHNDPERMLRRLHRESNEPDSNPMRAAALAEMIRDNSAFGRDRLTQYISGKEVDGIPGIRMSSDINIETQREMTRAATDGSTAFLQNPDLVEAYGKDQEAFLGAARSNASGVAGTERAIDEHITSQLPGDYWDNYAKKTDKILALGAYNADKLGTISYEDAIVMYSSPDFRTANPSIRKLITEVVNNPPSGSTAPARSTPGPRPTSISDSGTSLISGDEHGLR